jgi:hypothetical protein
LKAFRAADTVAVKPQNELFSIVRTSVLARVTFLAALAVTCLLVAAAPAGAAPKPPVRVVAPRVGEELPSRPLWLKVDLHPGARDLRATLNGQSIGHHFLRAAHGLRRLQVSPSHGLRFGRNVLRVSARYRGRRVRAGKVSFRIGTGRPLAAAGLNVVTAAGDAVRLDGGDSVAHPGAPGGPGALRYHWQIVDRDGSPGRASASGVDASPAATLRDADSPEPILEPVGTEDVTVKLTVTAPDGRSGSDLVSVRADPPPSVRIETSATRGDDRGVALRGPIDAFYKAEVGDWMQVVVLERQTLKFVSNTNYDCPEAMSHSVNAVAACVGELREDLAKLNDPAHSYLVIAVSQPGPDRNGRQYAVGFQDALRGYVHGWNWPAWSEEIPAPGSFAAIFTPGLPQRAVERISETAGSDASQIAGNLVRDNEGNFALAPTERVGFEVTAGGTGADQTKVVIGDRKFVAPIPAGSRGGFQVVLVNPLTLAARSAWFETAGTGADVGKMRAALAGAAGYSPPGTGTLVFIASHGNPSFTVNQGNALALRQLLDMLEQVGGTRGPAMQTLDARFGRLKAYTLLGTAFVGTARGEEATSATPLAVRGTLARSKLLYQYAVQPDQGPGSEPGQGIGSEQLIDAIEAPPTAWPEQGDKGKTAAIAWVGMQALGTDSPRSQFWTRPYDADSWGKVAAAIKELKMPAAAQAFNAADLDWAKGELVREIGWLGNAYDYLGALAKPFSDTGLKSWAAVQTIAARVEREVAPNDQAHVEAEAAAVWEWVAGLAEEIPGAGKAVALGAGTYEWVIKMGELDGEPVGGEFQSTVAEVGKELADRLGAAQSMLLRQVPDIVAADYGRLRTVGTCTAAVAAERASCPDGQGSWQLTQDDQQRVSKALETAAESSAYEAILPAKYTAYDLPVSAYADASGYHGYTYGGTYCYYPFHDLAKNGQLVRRIYEPMGGNFDTYQVTALGFREGKGTFSDRYRMMVPTAALLDHLFGTKKGQMGLNQERFFVESFRAPGTLDHFPELDTPMGWDNKCPFSSAPGTRLGAPEALGVGAASRRGFPVEFWVPGDRPATADLTVSLGDGPPRPPRPGKPLADGAILVRTMFRAASPGGNSVALTIPGRLARRVLGSPYRTATLRLRLIGAGSGPATASRTMRLHG